MGKVAPHPRLCPCWGTCIQKSPSPWSADSSAPIQEPSMSGFFCLPRNECSLTPPSQKDTSCLMMLTPGHGFNLILNLRTFAGCAIAFPNQKCQNAWCSVVPLCPTLMRCQTGTCQTQKGSRSSSQMEWTARFVGRSPVTKPSPKSE